MPGLVAFGSRWGIGSDDLLVPAVLEGLATIIWFTTLATTYLLHHTSRFFTENTAVRWFYSGGMLLAAGNLVLLGVIIHDTFKGTLINTWPRRNLPNWLKWKFVFGTICILFALPSTYWAFITDHGSDADQAYPIFTMRTAVFVLWIAITISSISWKGVFQHLESVVREKVPVSTQVLPERKEKRAYTVSWYERILAVVKFFGIQNHPEIGNVGKMFTEFFRGEDHVDLVPSDVVAGIVLLQQSQEQKAKKEAAPDMQPEPEPWMTVENCAHFVKYASAVYGWSSYAENASKTLSLMKVALRSRYIPQNIKGDNKFFMNTTALRMMTGIGEKDVFYASYINKLFEAPFVVALDHSKKSVVVAIRGTLSMEDVIVDLAAYESQEIPIQGQTDVRVHQGMLLTAQNLRKKLLGLDDQDHKVDEGLLEGAWKQLGKDVGEQSAKEYRLVIVGHSLGAGIASILALMLHEEEDYKSLHCFAFSPPGGLIRLTGSVFSRSFICGVVLGDDVVGRLGLYTVHDFRVTALRLIKDCDMAKHCIFGGMMRKLLGFLLGVSSKANSKAEDVSWKRDEEATKIVNSFQKEMASLIELSEAKRDSEKRLYPPGIILHMQEKAQERFLRSPEYSYTYTFRQGDSAAFEDILLSTNMLKHHMVTSVSKALDSLAST